MIDAEKANYPIAWMCRQLGVPRSSFYAWRARADTTTATTARRQLLAELVAEIFDDSGDTYGVRRVAAEINRRGHPTSVGLVADLMRERGLQACQPRAYKRTTLAGDDPVASPDLIERELSADHPGQRLSSTARTPPAAPDSLRPRRIDRSTCTSRTFPSATTAGCARKGAAEVRRICSTCSKATVQGVSVPA